ncbi:MAG: chemotaxis protein [Alphaproteobacteria bacterium]|nr:chemotaxis protein [Alphaproteobacteria bacterium]
MRIAATDSRIDSMKKTKLGARGMDASKIDATAQEFEAQFIAQMMENMFSTIQTNSEFGGGQAEEVYRSLLVNEYGKMIARTGGVGVADHVKREMIRMQEVSHD